MSGGADASATPRFLPRAQWLAVVEHAPLVALDLILRDTEGRILLGLRRNQPARGFWFVPGGAIRKNESLDAAFARISRTELGLELARADARLLGVYEHRYDSNFAGAPGIGTHYVVLAHEATVRAPIAPPDPQHEDWRWWTPEDLRVSEQVHAYVKAYFR